MGVVDTRNLIRQDDMLVDTYLLIYLLQGYRGGCMSTKALNSPKIQNALSFSGRKGMETCGVSL